jgi:biotin transport system substrate-specific component
MLSLAKTIFCLVSLVLAFLTQIPLFSFDFEAMTFQNFLYSPALLLVFVLSLIFKNNYALISLVIIFLAVLFGLPLFSFGGGWQYIFQPSFGFILAMFAMSVIIFYHCYHRERDENFKRNAILMLLAANLFGIVYFILFNSFDFIPWQILISQLCFDLIFAIIFIWLFKREV